MVDIDKIKPGDKVVWSGIDLLWPAYSNGRLATQTTKDGDLVTVGNPTTCVDSNGDVLVSVILACGSFIARKPERLRYLSEKTAGGQSPATSGCSCDIMSLMRVGCKCGHIIRERRQETNPAK